MIKLLLCASVMALANPTETWVGVDLFAVTGTGDVYVVGSGTDCVQAFQGAVFPKGWRLLTCLQSELDLNGE